jgi:hypothetical protein
MEKKRISQQLNYTDNFIKNQEKKREKFIFVEGL